MSQKKATSGGARLMAAGKRPILLGPDQSDYEKIKAAAKIDGRAMTQYILYHIVALSEKILKKSTN